MSFIHVIILGIVEGFTEFIPVSSTAHLLIVEKILRIPSSAFETTFTIAIQLGAIIAVVTLFGLKRFFTKETFPKLAIGFIPTAIAGFILYPFVKRLLGGSLLMIAVALGIGGILLLVMQTREAKKPGEKELTLWGAFSLGCFQALALIPGVSRSGGVLIGGLLQKYKQASVIDFSFMLAVPTIAAATLYDLYKTRDVLTSGSIPLLLVGGIVSFIVAYFSAKWFIAHMKKNGVGVYGWYRIVLAIVLLMVILI